MPINFKKILLAGTALVAVSFVSLQAQAAVGRTSVATETLAADAIGGVGVGAADGAAGTVGDAGLVYGAANITVTDPVAYVITGGAGQAGPTDANSSGGNAGGVGGTAVNFAGQHGTSLTVFTGLVNNSVITGGAGGLGGAGGAAAGNGGAGGVGGIGATADANFANLSGTGTITGGVGGVGGAGTAATTAGAAGGNGGAAVVSSGTSAVINNTGNVTGGAGGVGGVGVSTGVSGNGGIGGIAYSLTAATATLTVTGNATGGAGGVGGAVTAGGADGTAGTGGVGGIGIRSGSTGATIVIGAASTVSGGAGGAAGAANDGVAGAAGAAGVGLSIVAGATGGTITNSGIIVGGGTGAAISLSVADDTTTITNTGTIGNAAATANAVDVSNTSAITTLNNTNGDILAATGNVVNIGIGSAITTLNNTTGNITATTGIALNILGTVGTLTNTGGIISAAGTGAASTVFIDADQGAAGLSNSGTIRNTRVADDNGVALDISAVQAGTFTNTSTGTISASGSGGAGAGTAVNFSDASVAAFTNAGTVTGKIADTAAAITTLTNTGTITGAITLDGAAAHVFTFTSGTVTGAITGGSAVDTLTQAAGTITGAVNLAAGNNILTQTGGTIVGNITTTGGDDTITHTLGTITGNVDMGAGTNVFTQTAGTMTGTLTGGANVDTLALNGGAIVGATDLGAGNNVITVGGTFSSGGAIIASGGGKADVQVSTVGTGVLNMGHALTLAAGNMVVQTGGTYNQTAGTMTNSGTITTAGTGAIVLSGTGVITGTGAVTNEGALTVGAGSAFTAATQVAAAGAYTFGVTASNAGVVTNGLLTLSGGATNLTGSTIAIAVDPAAGFIADATEFQIIDGTAGATTPLVSSVTARAVDSDDSAIYSFTYATGDHATIGGSANDVWIIVDRAAVGDVAGAAGVITANDESVGAVLDTIGATGTNTPADGGLSLDTVQGNLANAATAAAVHDVLEAILPTVDGGAQMAAFDVGAQTQGINDIRMAAIRSGDGTTGMAAGASANGVTMWLQGYGQTANQDLRDGVAGYDASTLGGAIGIDTETLMSNGVVGVAFNYGRTNVESENVNTTDTDVDNYGISLYANYDLGQQMFLNGQLGYAYNDIESTRHNAGGAGLVANSDTNSNQYSAKLALGRDYEQEYGMTVTPVMSASYTNLDTDGYTETGTGVLQAVNGEKMNAVNVGISGTASWKMKNADGSVMKPSVRAGYVYDVTGERVEATSSFTGDPAANLFTTRGADPARHTFNAGVGMTYMTAADWDLSASYDFRVKEDFSAHSGILRASSHF